MKAIAVTEKETIRPLREEEAGDRRRRMRSIAIALALFLLVALFYAATIVRLGGAVLNRPL